MPGQVDGTNTMFFVHKSEFPPGRKSAEQNRTDSVWGKQINYPGTCGTPTTDLLTVKILLNSVISTPEAKFMTKNIVNFYLNTPLKRYKYLLLKLEDIPEDVRKEYKLKENVTTEGWVYVNVCRGIYGLPQAGLIVQELLAIRLDTHGYT